MRHILPIFATLCLALGVALAWHLDQEKTAVPATAATGPADASRQTGFTSSSQTPVDAVELTDPAAARSGAPVSEGDRLLMTALDQLGQRRSIRCLVRHRIDLYGQVAVGSGSLQQLNLGRDTLLRLELKMPIGGEVSTLLQVCDGRFSWTRKSFPANAPASDPVVQLGRVDLNVVRRVLSEHRDLPLIATHGHRLGQGGPLEMLSQIQHSFTFGRPRGSQLEGRPVWVITGHWRPHFLEHAGVQVAHDASQPDPELPPQLPSTVTLAFGQDDFFPYRVEYRQPLEDAKGKGTGVVASAQTKAALVMEYFDVEFDVPIDAHVFDYRPDNVQVTEQTDAYLDKILLVGKGRAGHDLLK